MTLADVEGHLVRLRARIDPGTALGARCDPSRRLPRSRRGAPAALRRGDRPSDDGWPVGPRRDRARVPARARSDADLAGPRDVLRASDPRVPHKPGTALLTGVGMVPVVFGIAAQNTPGNLVAGIGLIAYRPFQNGDHLLVAVPGGAEVGTIERVTLGHTTLATQDGRRIVIADAQVGTRTVLDPGAGGARGPADAFGEPQRGRRGRARGRSRRRPLASGRSSARSRSFSPARRAAGSRSSSAPSAAIPNGLRKPATPCSGARWSASIGKAWRSSPASGSAAASAPRRAGGLAGRPLRPLV